MFNNKASDGALEQPPCTALLSSVVYAQHSGVLEVNPEKTQDIIQKSEPTDILKTSPLLSFSATLVSRGINIYV